MQTITPYGGFKLDKNELYKLFFLIYNNPTFKKKELLLESGFGDNKIENLKYYLKHFNLLDKNYLPTELAKVIYTNDKYFEDEFTLWVLFYHWANRISNPLLYYLLNESLESKTKETLRKDFSSWAIRNDIKIDYKKDFLGGLISITVNSLSDSDAFKNLNVYKMQNEKFSRDVPYKINPLLVAYVLYENRQNRTTISFDELLKEPNNIGKFFNLDSENLLKQIHALRDFGLVIYNQQADLNHIAFTFQDSNLKLLERYYEQY
jgi:hypothetical protein